MLKQIFKDIFDKRKIIKWTELKLMGSTGQYVIEGKCKYYDLFISITISRNNAAGFIFQDAHLLSKIEIYDNNFSNVEEAVEFFKCKADYFIEDFFIKNKIRYYWQKKDCLDLEQDNVTISKQEYIELLECWCGVHMQYNGSHQSLLQSSMQGTYFNNKLCQRQLTLHELKSSIDPLYKYKELYNKVNN